MAKKSFHAVFEFMFHGKYDFTDFMKLEISNEYKSIEHQNRKIYSASQKLRDYHKFINIFISENLPINESAVFSYRKGYNVVDAVKIHRHSKYFFKSDIVNFFGSINSTLIHRTLKNAKEHIPISDIDSYIDRIISLISIDGTLPQGFSTSPLISNSCLLEFDNKILQYCYTNNIKYCRYSDDLVFSANEYEKIKDMQSIIESELFSIYGDQFKLHHSKSKINSISGKVKILGMVIMPNGEITVDSKIKNIIEPLLFYYAKNRSKFLELSGGSISNGEKKISSYINYINAVDGAYLDKLRKKYGVTIVDYFIHKSKDNR